MAALAISQGARAEIVFQDDFESGNLSKSVGTAKWMSGAGTSVSTAIARSGSHSLRFLFRGASSDAWAEQRFYLGQEYKEVHVEWYAFYPMGFEGVGAKYLHRSGGLGPNNKFIRLWKGDKSDGAMGYQRQYVKAGASSYRQGSDSVESIGAEYGSDSAATGRYNLPSLSAAITDSERGRWLKFRFVAKAASASGVNDGVIELYRDDVLAFRSTTVPLYASNGTVPAFEYGYLLGAANSGFDVDTSVYIDDVTISSGATGPTKTPSSPSELVVQ
jgi:hypothetical protein